MDTESWQLLEEAVRKTMTTASGRQLDEALAELGWLDMLTQMPDSAVPLVFRLLGETGSHAPVINDVVLHAAGRDAGGTVPLPFAGGSWVVWERTDGATTTLGGELPIRRVPNGEPLPLAAGRRALGWWLVGSSRAMLTRRASMPSTESNSVGLSPRSRPSGTGWLKPWSPSKARKPRCRPPAMSWAACWPKPRPARPR
ncbi:putative acyl-CoA dehydrogenase [Mycobacterium xenopi 4042]|uniref:Putative acyl-CoA dehydrogenase n=1 Tax=Mycobacterium xenopi 4042 TaxID=1299334 RepID=X8AHT6_MYCXE|nr:putative acyl-CoA dehydrogenase [Mycobacterium xenopi 4042]